MPKGSALTDHQKGQIDALIVSKKNSIRSIAKLIGKSDRVVRNYLKDRQNYGKKKRSGRRSSLTSRDKSHIIRLAGDKNISAAKIKAQLNLKQSTTTIWRVINSCDHLKREKRDCKPALKPHHKIARLKWAKDCMTWSSEWEKIIFSDEKKFNLDDPDGLQYYWRDIRKPKQKCKKRIHGGGSVMVWGAIGSKGKSNLVIINTRMNSNDYTEMLSLHLLPFGKRIAGKNWIYMNDNAAIHCSKHTKSWFTDNQVDVLSWPALSPDLNPIENVWGILSRKVYEGGRQFDDVNSRKNTILVAWEEISVDYIKTLIDSMPNRIYKVILNKGNSIDN